MDPVLMCEIIRVEENEVLRVKRYRISSTVTGKGHEERTTYQFKNTRLRTDKRGDTHRVTNRLRDGTPVTDPTRKKRR